PKSTWISNVLPDEWHMGSVVPRKSIFDSAQSHVSSDNSTAFLLTIKPHFPSISIDDAASYTSCNGHWLPSPLCHLPFSNIHAWDKFHMQQHSAQDLLSLSPPQTIQAIPLIINMPWGWANTILI
ncbi:hypothetical protein EDD16DRAFT_1450420, partial [Pisolithus croceorrhizus]